jgi:hypothetical protein
MSKIIDPRYPPQQFKASKYSPVIIVDYLSREDKDSLWLHLKEHHPEKAKALITAKSDSFVKMIIKKKSGLNALLAIELKYVPEHLKRFQHLI